MSDNESKLEKLSALIIKRRSVKGPVTKFHNYLKTVSESDCTDPKLCNELDNKIR